MKGRDHVANTVRPARSIPLNKKASGLGLCVGPRGTGVDQVTRTSNTRLQQPSVKARRIGIRCLTRVCGVDLGHSNPWLDDREHTVQEWSRSVAVVTHFCVRLEHRVFPLVKIIGPLHPLAFAATAASRSHDRASATSESPHPHERSQKCHDPTATPRQGHKATTALPASLFQRAVEIRAS